MRIHSLLLAGTGLALLASADIAAAQQVAQAASGLEEIVVTARRQEEQLQSVPLAITAVTGEQLESREITTSERFSHMVPALSLNSPFGDDAITNIRLRGLPGVASYFAEVPTRLTGNALFVDMQNIQVLKGPQGVNFGINTTGGAILFEPRRPTNQMSVDAKVLLGNYKRREYQAVVNAPVVPDKVLLRVVYDHNERKGYTYDLTNKVDLADQDYHYARAGLTIKPFDTFENYTVIDWFQSNGRGPGALLTAVNTASTANLLFPALRTTLAQQQALGVRTIVGQDAGLGQLLKNENFRVVDIARWDITDVFSFKNIASYSREKQAQRVDLDGSPSRVLARAQFGGWQDDKEFFTEEPQISAKLLNNSLNMVAGYFISYQRVGSDTKEHTVTFNDLATTDAFFYKNGGGSQRTRGIYGQAIYDLGGLSPSLDQFKLSAGYRYTWDFRSSVDSRRAFPSGACSVAGADSTCRFQQTGKFHASGWNLTLDYEVVPDTMLYVRNGRGYTSGGFNPFAPPELKFYKPEFLTDIEVGVKSDWRLGEMQARTNAAYFHSWYKNIQRSINSTFIDALGRTQISSVTANAAKAHLDGFEIEATLLPVPSLELTAGFSHVVGKYDSYVTTDPATLRPLDLSGEAFTNFPENQFTGSARYHLPIAETLGDLSVELNYNWQSKTYFGLLAGDVGAKENAYGELGARVDWRNIANSGVDAGFFVTNLTNKTYRLGSFTVFTSLGLVSDVFAPPRMYGFELKYRWNS